MCAFITTTVPAFPVTSCCSGCGSYIPGGGALPQRCDPGTMRVAPFSGVKSSSIHTEFATQYPRSSDTAPLSACSRSEEHTSELQSPCNLVCRLLLEKK